MALDSWSSLLYLPKIKKAIPGIDVQIKKPLHSSGIGLVTTVDDLADVVGIFYHFNMDSIFDIWGDNFKKVSFFWRIAKSDFSKFKIETS